MSKVLVIQSHRTPLPASWYQHCVDSVRAWADAHGFAYRWLDDALFDPLPVDIREKTAKAPVVAADLGRLYALQAGLTEGYDCVVWVDADTLVLNATNLRLPAADHAFGREIWVQEAGAKLKVYRKIHNAFMCFRQGNSVLEFYLFAAQRLLRRHNGPMVPQLIGPKFLTVLHNIVDFPVLETAAMLSPVVIGDLLGRHTGALRRFREAIEVTPAAVNLSGSMVLKGELADADMVAVIELLRREPALLGVE